MDTSTLALLIAEIIIIWAVLTAVQIPLRKKKRRALRTAVFVVKLLLIPIFAMLAESIEWAMPYTHGDILCAFYIALIGDVAASVFEYCIRRVQTWGYDGDEDRHKFDNRIGVPVGLAVCMIVLVSGTVNAETIRMDTHEWQADGLEQEHTFAFASDLHAGSSLSMDELREFCGQVNGSDAEFLVLGGDITDELTSYEEMVETYAILSTVDVPIYMVFGNHDRQPGASNVGGRTYTDEQLMHAIDDAGITVLTDEFVLVSDDLVLLGREDISRGDERKDWSDLVNPYEGLTLIVADHQPFDKEQLRSEVSALQISGHTHAGQLWPLRTLQELFGLYPSGEYHLQGTRLFVTPGVGGWAPYLRTADHSGWELITLHP